MGQIGLVPLSCSSQTESHLVFTYSPDQFQGYCALLLVTAALKHVMLPVRCRKGRLQPGSASQIRAALWDLGSQKLGCYKLQVLFWMGFSCIISWFPICKVGKVFILYYTECGACL